MLEGCSHGRVCRGVWWPLRGPERAGAWHREGEGQPGGREARDHQRGLVVGDAAAERLRHLHDVHMWWVGSDVPWAWILREHLGLSGEGVCVAGRGRRVVQVDREGTRGCARVRVLARVRRAPAAPRRPDRRRCAAGSCRAARAPSRADPPSRRPPASESSTHLWPQDSRRVVFSVGVVRVMWPG